MITKALFISMIAVLICACSSTAKLSQQDLDQLFQKAQSGDAKSQNTLGSMYANGENVSKDEAEAVKWLLLAAKQGLPVAQRNIGICFNNGYGVPLNKVEAYAWFNLCANSYDDARELRDQLDNILSSAERIAAQKRTRQLEEGLLNQSIVIPGFGKEPKEETPPERSPELLNILRGT
jgi:hypothetical protein